MCTQIFRQEEIAAFRLRHLYSCYKYSFYRMSRFEEYDFYADKKDFLGSGQILTFTDINGRLMALRPDVTLSVIRHFHGSENVRKVYYDEKVYRVPAHTDSFREISQAGVECIGQLTDRDIAEVLRLAVMSLETVSQGRNYVLDIADAGMISGLIPDKHRQEFIRLICAKNIHELRNSGAPEKLLRLLELDGDVHNALPELDKRTAGILTDIADLCGHIRVDFSTVSNLNYYNGLVFRGFIEGIPAHILSGGQYDGMMAMMGHKNTRAVGFAVYLDLIQEDGND